MAATTSRTLELLSLLQSHRHWSARELVDRLGVSRPHAAARRRAAARARLRHRVDARGSRAATGSRPAPGCRRCSSPTTRASRSPSGCARRRRRGCAAPSTRRSARSPRSSRCCRPPCAAASTRCSRTRPSASARAQATGRRRPSRHRTARAARARLPRLRAAALPVHGCRGRVHPRASSSRTGSCPWPALVPARLGPRARRLAHVPPRPHQRRLPDAGALRAAADDRRGRPPARRGRTALARPQRARPGGRRHAAGRADGAPRTGTGATSWPTAPAAASGRSRRSGRRPSRWRSCGCRAGVGYRVEGPPELLEFLTSHSARLVAAVASAG